MDSFRGRTIDVQVSLLSVTIHLLSFPSFGWRTNVKLSCKHREQAERPQDALRSVGDCQIQFLVRPNADHFSAKGSKQFGFPGGLFEALA